jgi:hypothetical protein
MIYLYKKIHNITGMQYLGKTCATDPHKYKGSGTYWKRHIQMHGNDVLTEIIKECNNNDEIKFWGSHYSKLWDVVNSKNWANLVEETGAIAHNETSKPKFTFYHVSGIQFHGTQNQFRKAYPKVHQPTISQLIKGNRNSTSGWYINKELMNKKFEQEYSFYKPTTQEVFTGTITQMISKYPKVNRTDLYKLISGAARCHKGWFLDENSA